MKPRVTQRPRARLDLLEQFVYLGEQENVELAERYLEAVEATCARLAIHPESGKLYDCGVPSLDGLRRFPVHGFENYLVFYLRDPDGQDGIDVFRVLHGARDFAMLLSEDGV